MDKDKTFVCKRCHYTTNLKSNLYRHLTKTKKCSPSFRDVPIEELIESLEIRKHDETLRVHHCNMCEAKFTDISNLNRHKKCKHPINNLGGIANTAIQGDHNTTNITNAEQHAYIYLLQDANDKGTDSLAFLDCVEWFNILHYFIIPMFNQQI